MLKKDLILRNPLRLLSGENEEILSPGSFGAVLARAGVGKTALLVQLALNSLLRNNNVLHISLSDPVDKVCLWYEEVFRNIAQLYKIKDAHQPWEEILPHRFIMTFKVEGFSVPKLEERLTDLTEQGVFFPQVMLIDGYPFENANHSDLKQLKALIQNYSLHCWFAVLTHRDDPPGPDGLPSPFHQVSDLFDSAIQLVPEGKEIYVKALKGASAEKGHPDIFLDPATMLIKDN
ncbi:MAG: cytoplasmic protein [Desulfobacterales bacterium]|nr:cytoplasmic protein [Desulfobacterales bacterium]